MNVGNVPGLFDLSKCDVQWQGYWMNGSDEIFSTKMGGNPRRMTGSRTVSGTYFTFSRNGSGNSYNKTQITGRARLHRDFAKETAILVVSKDELIKPRAAVALEKMVGRDHAVTPQEGIKQKGYIIGSLVGDALLFGSKPQVHTTLKSVKAEMERLAAKSPGRTMIYCKIEGSCRAASMVWE